MDKGKGAISRYNQEVYVVNFLQERKKRGESDSLAFLADIYAYQGKFQEAAKLYKKTGNEEKVQIIMYAPLARRVRHWNSPPPLDGP